MRSSVSHCGRMLVALDVAENQVGSFALHDRIVVLMGVLFTGGAVIACSISYGAVHGTREGVVNGVLGLSASLVAPALGGIPVVRRHRAWSGGRLERAGFANRGHAGPGAPRGVLQQGASAPHGMVLSASPIPTRARKAG